MGLIVLHANLECAIEVESYGFSTKDMVVKPLRGQDSIDVEMQTAISELYRLTNTTATTKTMSLSTGNYTRIQFTLKFESSLRTPQGALLRLWENRLSKK